jgi:hypothetical protein
MASCILWLLELFVDLFDTEIALLGSIKVCNQTLMSQMASGPSDRHALYTGEATIARTELPQAS